MMVAESPEQIRDEAICLFRTSDVPAAFGWVGELSPLNQRLFIVELSDAIKESVIRDDLGSLTMLVDGWKATAALDAAPEVLEEVKRAKDFRPLSSFSA